MSLRFAPPGLVKDLAGYDKHLRLRWASHRGVWSIERKLPRRHPALEAVRPDLPLRAPAVRDAFEAVQDGYVPVLFVRDDPEVFNWPTISAALHQRDLHTYGSWDALNRRLDELTEQEEADKKRLSKNWAETGAKDLHDRIAWADGRRVSGYDPDPLERLEEREGYKVLDRRVVA